MLFLSTLNEILYPFSIFLSSQIGISIPSQHKQNTNSSRYFGVTGIRSTYHFKNIFLSNLSNMIKDYFKTDLVHAIKILNELK